jgi:hypothetical protein
VSFCEVLRDKSTTYIRVTFMLRVLDCTVTISFGVHLVLWLLYLVLSREGFVMCGCFDNCVGV